MNILVCGSFMCREFEQDVDGLSIAANQYQMNLYNTLRMKYSVKGLSYLTCNCKEKEKMIWERCEKEEIFPIFSYGRKMEGYMMYRKKLRELIEWADEIITYNAFYPWYGVSKMAEKKQKKSVLILADITPPEEEQKFTRKVFASMMLNEIKKYTKVVALSERGTELVGKNQEVVVVNGCLHKDKIGRIPKPHKSDVTSIAYTGLISEVTGVNLLLEAFQKIPGENYKLTICGQGDIESIQDHQIKDKRVQILGLVSNEKYLQVLEDADILINPRNMNFLQNRYNFPSKVLEYIAAGRIVVSTKFNGYEAYDENVIFTDSTSESLMIAILKAEEIKYKSDVIYDKNVEFAKSYEWEKQIENFI